MPANGRPNLHAEPARRGRRGEILLAAAWVLLLGAGALAGWLAAAAEPPERAVHTATLHRGDLREPAPANAAAEAIDPWVRQLAAPPSLGADARRAEPTAQAEPQADLHAEAQAEAEAKSRSELQTERTSSRDAAGDARPHPSANDRARPADGDDGKTAGADPAPDLAAGPGAIPQVRLAARTDGPDAAPPAAGPPPPPPVPRSVVGPATRPAAEETGGRYSVQVGAFRQRENAVERAARLSQAGYEVRIVHAFATRSRLYMVRLGQFDARPAAMAYARRLAQDVGMETWPVRN